MVGGDAVCRLNSYSTGDKTGEDDGEDGRVDEKFHDWLPPGGYVTFLCGRGEQSGV